MPPCGIKRLIAFALPTTTSCVGDPFGRGSLLKGELIEHLLPVRIRAIYEDNEARLWFATDGGLMLYMPDTHDFIPYYITDA